VTRCIRKIAFKPGHPTLAPKLKRSTHRAVDKVQVTLNGRAHPRARVRIAITSPQSRDPSIFQTSAMIRIEEQK